MADRNGQVALIIGGTGAIGQATARHLASEGADIAFTYRANTKAAAALSDDIIGRNSLCRAAAVSIEEADAVEAFISETVAEWGRIDTLVYAAGPPFSLEFVAKVTPAEWSHVIDADLKGCFNAAHFALPHLRKTQGSMVAVTAAAVERAIPRDILSLAPKAAITALIRGIAKEEGRFGVRANCVAPGFIAGGLGQAIFDSVGPDVAAAMVKSVPLQRMGSADEVADAIAYISSARASYITGTTLYVGGGMEL